MLSSSLSAHLLALLATALLAVKVHSQESEERIDLLKAALIANQANLDSLPRYKCRFTRTKATADTQTTALKGEWKNTSSCEFVLVVDKGKQKLQAFANVDVASGQKVNRENDGRRSTSVPFVPVADLKVNDAFLRYFRPFKNAQLSQNGKKSDDGDSLPLSMNCVACTTSMSPAKLFLNDKGYPVMLAGQGLTKLEDQAVIHFHGTAKSIDYEYFFDVSRGYLPAKIISRSAPPWSVEKLEVSIYLREARECSKGRWFPMVWLEVIVAPESKQIRVNEIRVTELDCDRKLTEEDFAITIPAGTSIERPTKDGTGPPTTFRLRQDEKVTPDDIARLNKMLDDIASVPAGKEALMDTAIVQSNRFAWAKWPLIGGGCVLLMGAALLYRRRGKAVVN